MKKHEKLINSDGSTIGGGNLNRIAANSIFSAIGNGEQNIVEEQAEYAFIGGGSSNQISVLGSIALTPNNAIGGGINNNIPFGSHNVILGGRNNTLSGDCSAILGGCNNNDNGFDLVGIYGNTVNAVMSNAFHANNYAVQNMPTASTTLGQLFFDPTAGNAVFIA